MSNTNFVFLCITTFSVTYGITTHVLARRQHAQHLKDIEELSKAGDEIKKMIRQNEKEHNDFMQEIERVTGITISDADRAKIKKNLH